MPPGTIERPQYRRRISQILPGNCGNNKQMLDSTHTDPFVNLVVRNQERTLWRYLLECACGGAAVSIATLVCFKLQLPFAVPTCLYLMIIVLLSLRGSFISSAVVSVFAVLCLTYYFAPPIFSFHVNTPANFVAIVTFLLTSAIVTRLVSALRRLMERKLQRSEAYLAEAQRLSHTGSFGWNLSTGKIVWSEETFRIFQYEPTTRPTLELVFQRVHPEDVDRVKRIIERASKDAGDFQLEHRLLMPDGEVKYLEVVAHSEKDESDEAEFVGAVTDVSARRRAEEALQKAQLQLAHASRLTTAGELTAAIAHEVNQPLAAVVTNANATLRWLGRSPPELEEAREAVQRIVRDGTRGADVVARVRGLLRKEPPCRERLNVNQLIQDTIVLCGVNSGGSVLQTELGADLPEVIGDRVQLQQVLVNLIVNALDAMKTVTERPRVLRLKTRRHENREVLVAVQDSGVGLGPGSIEHLFETFYTTKPGGLGMGLSICRSIIEGGHGGRLWAEPASGFGAVFQFTLPINEEGAS